MTNPGTRGTTKAKKAGRASRAEPVLAMCARWHAAYDRLDDLVSFASMREGAMFQASPEERPKARRLANAAGRARDALLDRLQVSARKIFAVRAHSLEGVAAKLTVAIRDGEPSPDDMFPPWPYLRSIRTDLDRLLAAQAASLASAASARPTESAGLSTRFDSAPKGRRAKAATAKAAPKKR
jgi:hypothetical protein